MALCQDNTLPHVSNTKELVIDFRKSGGVHTPVGINGAVLERVQNFKFLDIL